MVSNSIIEAVKNKERDAFKLMYNQCIPYVYTIVKRYISNESDIPDVIQEIFARVFLSIGTYKVAKGDFKPWLRRLAINQCFQYHRQEKSIALHVALDNAPEIEDQDMGLNELTKEEIEFLLRQMPKGYRQVFMLVIIDEYNHKEVGDLLGISPEASRSQLSRAKNWLRKYVSKTNNTDLGLKRAMYDITTN